MPSSSLYRYRFGSLLRAYSLIGYAPDRDYRYIEINRHIRESFPTLLAEIVAGLESAGGTVVCDPVTHLLSDQRRIHRIDRACAILRDTGWCASVANSI